MQGKPATLVAPNAVKDVFMPALRWAGDNSSRGSELGGVDSQHRDDCLLGVFADDALLCPCCCQLCCLQLNHD